MDTSFSTLDHEIQCHIEWLLASPFMQNANAVGCIHGEAHGQNLDTWLEVTKKEGVLSLAAYAYDSTVYNSNKLPNPSTTFDPNSPLLLDIQAFKPRDFLFKPAVKATAKEITSFSLTCLFYTCHRAWLHNDTQRFNQAFDGICSHVPWLKEIKSLNDQAHVNNSRSAQCAAYHLGLALHQSNIFENHTDEHFVTHKLRTLVQKTFTALNMQSSLAYLFTTRTVDVPLLYALQNPKSKKTTGYLLKILKEPEMDEERPIYTHSWLDAQGALLFVMEDGTNSSFRGKHRCLADNPPVESTIGLNPLPYAKLVDATLVLQNDKQKMDIIERWATSKEASIFHNAWSNSSRDTCAVPMAKWAIDAWCAEHPQNAQILAMLLPSLHGDNNSREKIDNAPLVGQWRSSIGVMLIASQAPELYSVSSMGLDGP